MSIGSSTQVHYALSYIDELLSSFSLHPTKSSQFVFQRLLITCGSGWYSVSRHAANCLLSSMGVSDLPPSKNCLLSEGDAAKLVALILKFATEIQNNRSSREVKGATYLYNSLVDICSDIIDSSNIGKSDQPGYLHGLVAVLTKFCFLSADTVQQVCFLCSLRSQTAVHILDNFLHGSISSFFEEWSSDQRKISRLRIEFISRIVGYLVKSPPSDFENAAVDFVKWVLSDDSRHDREKKAIQPYLFLILARGRSSSVTIETLFSQASAFIEREGISDIRNAIRMIHSESLALILKQHNLIRNESLSSCISILRSRQINNEFFKEDAIAATIIYFTNSWDDSQLNDAVERKFVAVVDHFNAQCNWCKVFDLLDAPSFFITKRYQLEIVINTIILGLNGKAFSTKKLYDVWINAASQLSLLKCITEFPDVFCLTEHCHHPIHYISMKSTQEESDKCTANWLCGDLTISLLAIENSRPDLRVDVRNVFNIGISLCPDIVLIGLFQFRPSDPELYDDLIEKILLGMIPSHPNINQVLSVGWNSNNVFADTLRSIIMNVFILYYKEDKNDFNHLTRILDLVHELKPSGLTSLLEMKDLEFTLLLACIASRRDYLNLYKWLEDKKLEKKDELIKTIFTVLKSRAPPTILSSSKSSIPLAEDICNTLLRFCALNVTETVPLEFRDILEKSKAASQPKMKESGRSSSVSSTGRAPLPGFPNPHGDLRLQRPTGLPSAGIGQQPFGSNFSFGPGSTSNSPLQGFVPGPQSQPHILPNVGINNSNIFGSSQDFLNMGVRGGVNETNPMWPGFPPGSHMSNVGGNSNNQVFKRTDVRTTIAPPVRQNSGSSGWTLPNSGSSSRIGVPPVQQQQHPQQLDYRGVHAMHSVNPDYQNLNRPGSSGVEGDLTTTEFPSDVQGEANGYFEQIYSPNSALTVTDLIERLKRYKNSGAPRDVKVLTCVVKNLFDEYQFFKDYPERELRTTAEMYGGIIREGLIGYSNIHFATALRKIMESLSSDVNSKLWTFGIVSLDSCKNKLRVYPKICSVIAAIENFKHFPKQLQDYVIAGCNGEHPVMPMDTSSQVVQMGRSTPPFWPPRSSSADGNKVNLMPSIRAGSNVLSCTNADTLLLATEKEGAHAVQPSEAVVDKISFLFNNLSGTNIYPKREEVLCLIAENGESFIRWLAQYIVIKRVSIEQNFQPLYNQFVQAVNHPLLDLHIKKETFRNIRILLRSEKRQAATNYSDRQLLKNLGSWLGSITIARSQPILLTDLDLKSLLLEAYYKGQQELLFVVPFIAKILMSCSKTPIFNASCSWIRAILKVLAELHNEPDLKINLKFEIEVLCKELNIQLLNIPIEGVLKDTERLIHVPQQLCELKLLARSGYASNSPVPNQMRASESLATPGFDSKPGTPQVETDVPSGQQESSTQQSAVAQSHFAYHDINVVSYDCITPHIHIKPNLGLFAIHPNLKQIVKPAIIMAIKELIGPVAERAQKIALTVTENLVKKDFALDPEEKNIKVAAFHMMRAATAGMAMITCREPLFNSIFSYLQSLFNNSLTRSHPNAITPEITKLVDESAHVIVTDNIELATNFIVKSSCEKAATELEKRLDDDEYQRRISARRDNIPFVDEAAEKIQASLPAKIRRPVGVTGRELLEVYGQFNSRICGFKKNGEHSSDGSSLPMPDEKQCEHLTQQLAHYVKEVDTAMNVQPNINNKAYQAVGWIRDILSILSSNPRDTAVVSTCITKSTEHLLHAFHVDPHTKNPLDIEWPRRLRDLYLGVVRLLAAWIPLPEISRRVTLAIINLNADYKWNVEATEVLLKHNLIQSPPLDEHLSLKMSSQNVDAATFAHRLFRSLCHTATTAAERDAKMQLVKEAFPLSYDQIVKLIQQQANPVSKTVAPIEIGGNNGTESPLPGSDAFPTREENREISQKVESILREWISLCYTPMAQRNPQEALAQMIHTMHEHGVLSTDEKVSIFFRMCTEMCVDVTLRMLKQDPGNSFHQSTIIRQRCYYTLDAYVKLIALMIKHSDGTQAQTKITLLKKVLLIVANVLDMDHEVRKAAFNSMPYHRILISLFNELTANSSETNSLEPIAWNILEAFGQVLFMLHPRRCPGFAFAWLDIVGHRNFIGRLLGGDPESNPDYVKMTAMYTQLIICHLKFLAPFLRNIHLPKSISVLYKGTLRVLLVILHDFPELLCEFHYVICDTIPPNCVQLRNLILSAYPRNMRLPDPFALDFKDVDSIPDMAIEPKSNLNMATIIPQNIRQQLDEFLTNRREVQVLVDLPRLLQVSQTPGSKYNTTVMNAIVLYVGIRAIENLHARREPINVQTIAHTSFMDVFQNLAVMLCTEGRYLLFNAIANQLRYPNAHTHYFSCVFLFLFLNSDNPAIQEQITRILFERLVALRPHPWGLLITFIELIKNPIYKFWSFEFTRCAPEIERLFRNVASTCVDKSPSGSTEVASNLAPPRP